MDRETGKHGNGGGLQALASLSILNNICEAIAENNGTRERPSPYQLFDIIGGIGTGGWLALLLGRYRLGIPKCMSVYMEIANVIDPQTTNPETLLRRNKPFRLDQKRLIAKIEQVLKRYDLDPYLLDKDIAHNEDEESLRDVRCRFAFAAGAIEQPKEGGPRYEIFRTYRIKKRHRGIYHDGPNPAQCRVSAACAATGAAKYLLAPYKIGSTTFSDKGFPNPHNISSLALDEAYQVCGGKPRISVMVNVGPGIPSPKDLKELEEMSIKAVSRKFSWPSMSSFRIWGSNSAGSDLNVANVSSLPGREEQPKRTDTTTSSESSISRASEEERKLEAGIRERLDEMYGPGGRARYHRIGPTHVASDSVALNDVSAVDVADAEMDKFLDMAETKLLVFNAARQYWIEASA